MKRTTIEEFKKYYFNFKFETDNPAQELTESFGCPDKIEGCEQHPLCETDTDQDVCVECWAKNLRKILD